MAELKVKVELKDLEEFKGVVQENAQLRAMFDLIGSDMHMTSSRPCPTCQTISKAIDKPFGCYARKGASRG
jgi:hypothetical protein